MNLYQSKCENCEDRAYVFPDQVEQIKRNPQLALYKYCKEKLYVGAPWFCIKCDASGKNGLKCKISEQMPSDKAKKLLDIRSRETSLKAKGFYLPE